MARILDADAARTLVDGLVHPDTQTAAAGFDLTVSRIFRLTGPGSLDFGGSEREDADRAEIEPRFLDEDDDYGWWTLDLGSYVLRYNESLTLEDEHIGHVFPLERLLQAGASHPAFVVDGHREPLESLLVVGSVGMSLKENARVSRLVVMDRNG